MEVVVVPVEQIAKVGENALTVLESVIRLLGPFRPGHPQWKVIQEDALKSLSPEHGELAQEMSRAIELVRKAETRLALVTDEMQKLDLGAYYLLPVGYILRELRRRKLVEVLGDAAAPSIRVLGSPEEMREIAEQVLKSKARFAARARVIAMKFEEDARPAIRAAEHRFVTQWVEAQGLTLDRLVDEFRGLVTKHKLDLAALVEPATKLLLGRWTGSSHCAAILEMLSEAADQLRKPLFSESLKPVLSRVNWKSLRHQFEAELGSWQSRHAGKRAAPKGLRPMSYIFARVIVDAGGKRLTVKEIFASAISNPLTARFFRSKSLNSNHRKAISGLAGYRTEDGFVICKEGSGHGESQSLWSERVAGATSAAGTPS